MSTWRISYDVDDELWGVSNCSEDFTGTWEEMHEYVQYMNKHTAAYNIEVTCISEEAHHDQSL